jgi:hypothetical protein
MEAETVLLVFIKEVVVEEIAGELLEAFVVVLVCFEPLQVKVTVGKYKGLW